MSRPAALLAIGLVAFLIAPHHSAAQAWLPLKGEGTVSMSFQRVVADGHFLDDGSKLPGYRTQARNFIFTLTYGVTEHMALAFTVPFVNVKYMGPEEPVNLPANVLDDGTYHGTVSDLGFQFRYNVLERPLVVTPFFTAGVPSHAYDTLGEAAPGRNFQEYHFGTYVGRLLDPVLPRAFVHANYAYAFVRQDLDIPLNYSSFNLEAGYFITSSFAVSFLYRQQWTHGGLTFDELWVAPPDVFVNMDRVVRQNFQHLGVAGSYSLTSSVSVFANYWNFVSGSAAHYGDGFSVGLSWTFHTRTEEILFPTSAAANTAVPGLLRGAR
jgi:hypothetical protein